MDQINSTSNHSGSEGGTFVTTGKMASIIWFWMLLALVVATTVLALMVA